MSQPKIQVGGDWGARQDLFSAYLRGDAHATYRLFTELKKVLQAYFRVRLSAEAEVDDMVQATLLKIHFARDRFDPKQSLKTWVFTIASRSLIDHWRGKATESEVLDPGPAAGDGTEAVESAVEGAPSGLADPALRVELQNDVNNALMKLKPMDRSIVYLYGVEGLAMAEIARILFLTEGAVKLRAHRAYAELRKHL